MERFKKLGKALLFPHGAVFIVLVPLSAALLGYSFAAPQPRDVVRYLSYFLSAYTLTALCCRLPSLLRFWKRFGQENKYAVRYRNDTRLRVNLSLGRTLALNSVYAVFQLGLGIYHGSVWYYAMAAYYTLLAVMRFYLLRYTGAHAPGENRRSELHRYRFCGAVLVAMNLALSAMVFYITWKGRTVVHHKITTIALAAYTFTAFTLALVNVVRYRKYNSPVLSAVKIIGFTAAMVSMLTLETTMLTAFGETENGSFNRTMTGVSGAVVVLAVLGIASTMIAKSTRELKTQASSGGKPYGQ